MKSIKKKELVRDKLSYLSALIIKNNSLCGYLGPGEWDKKRLPTEERGRAEGRNVLTTV